MSVLVLFFVTTVVAFKIYTSNYYAADNAVIQKISADEMRETLVFSDDDCSAFVPKNGNYRAVIVFYPGGKVEYSAYDSLMYELSSRGFICLLVRMPDNIALLGVNAVNDLLPDDEKIQQTAESLDWYLAGHSLGGTAATKYLADHLGQEPGEKMGDVGTGNGTSAGADHKAAGAVVTGADGEGQVRVAGNSAGDNHAGVVGIGRFKGLILCGSYPSSDLSGAPIRMLSVYGSNDGVMRMGAYERARTNWPADSEEVVIEGGNHSYFGSYGIQSGDGVPTLTNEQQIEKTADIIDEWIG